MNNLINIPVRFSVIFEIYGRDMCCESGLINSGDLVAVVLLCNRLPFNVLNAYLGTLGKKYTTFLCVIDDLQDLVAAQEVKNEMV